MVGSSSAGQLAFIADNEVSERRERRREVVGLRSE